MIIYVYNKKDLESCIEILQVLLAENKRKIMHNINLEVDDNIYQNIMFLLNNLNLTGLKIKEDNITSDKSKLQENNIDFSNYKVNSFKDIKDPVEWQRDTREEWN